MMLEISNRLAHVQECVRDCFVLAADGVHIHIRYVYVYITVRLT